MPIYRDENGNIVDEPTRKGGEQGSVYEQETRRVGPGAGAPQGGGNYDAETRRIGGGSAGAASSYDQETRKVGAAQPAAEENADAKTQIYRPGKKVNPAASGQAEEVTEAGGAMEDPPVAWLVITQGPGKGEVLTVGIGANSIGRDPADRITIDFGDGHISRNAHATITYDPRGRKFYIQHGGGKNLTYVNDAPVLAPTEIASSAQILIGDTLMRFVSLCGPDFDWVDLD